MTDGDDLKKGRQFFEGTKIGVTPPVAATGDTNPSDAIENSQKILGPV